MTVRVISRRRVFELLWILSIVGIYAMVLPPVSPNVASAHFTGWDVVGLNPVGSNTYPHLDWWDDNTSLFDQVNVAKVQWNALGHVIIGQTVVNAKIDVWVRDIYNCSLSWYGTAYQPFYQGIYYAQIVLNTCLLWWPTTDYYPGAGRTIGPTTERARRRTLVHEFGHEIGFAHSDSDSPVITDVCQSVMTSAYYNDQDVCYQPKQHDIDDMNFLH